MSVSRPQAAASANTTSASISSTSAGDLILVFAYNKTNNTIATLPAGYSTLTTATTANGAARVGWKRSAGGDTSTGTWTNATNVSCIVLRATYCMFGAFAITSGSGTTLTYLGMTATNGCAHYRSSGSWVAGFGGARSATAGMNGNTANLTNETSQTNINALDSEAVLTSFADETLSVTTSGEWITITIEVLDAVAQLPGNVTQAVTMYSQARTDPYHPGFARVTHYTGINQYGLIGGLFRSNGMLGAPGTGLMGNPNRLEPSHGAADTLGAAMGSSGLVAPKRTDVGNPTPPSQLQNAPGKIAMFIPVEAGARTVQIDARYWPDSGAGFRPKLRVMRDLDTGIQDDIEVEAASSAETEWATITLNFTVAVDCTVLVYREQTNMRQDAWTLWDNLQVN